MISSNPFGDFRAACNAALSEAFLKSFPDISIETFLLEIPSNLEFGELTSPVFFELAKKISGIEPRKLADKVANEVNTGSFPLLKAAKAAGAGYVNFYVDFHKLCELTIESTRILNKAYGFVKTEEAKTIIVEHTSSNPISPIHIGQARNPILGDALAHLLEARGHKVFRHFYIDDVGRQTAVVAYGYKVLGQPALKGKSDHDLGVIYSITSCISEIHRLKRATKMGTMDSETLQQLRNQQEEWDSIASELEKKHPRLFKKLSQKLEQTKDIENMVNDLNRNYEEGNEEAKKLIRKVCQISLQGIRQTLTNAEVYFDSWDWESDLIWNGSVTRILEELKKSDYVFRRGPVLEFDADKVAEDLLLKKKIGVKDDYEIPSLTLIRGDGTTLYTTRDISYTLWKFNRADKVINVVGMEQLLPQQQLKLALWALKHNKQADNLTHFAYSLVTLPGYKMSSRRGRYIAFDEVIDESQKRALEEVEKRSPHLSEKEKHQISKIVGLGALKYALVEVDPAKPVVFTWERVLNLKGNSAPYIQYTYARARSILRKAHEKPKQPNYSLLDEPLEKDLVLGLARFPEIFIDSADNLKPNAIADYTNTMAEKFSRFYDSIPVVKVKPIELSDARLALVEATSIVIQNSLGLLGIVSPERM